MLVPAALFSTLGRVAARGIETLVTAEMLSVWLDELIANIKRATTRFIMVRNGNRLPGLKRHRDTGYMKRPAEPWGTG